MSPISLSSVSTQILQAPKPPPNHLHGFDSPVHMPSLQPSIPPLSQRKSNNVRILSAVARRRNPYLVCELDYLRALLGSPDAISKRLKGPKGRRVSWIRVLTALALLTGHKRRNINGTRSRWGRTPDKQVSLEQAQRLLGDVLTRLDETPDVEEGEDDPPEDRDEFLDDEELNNPPESPGVPTSVLAFDPDSSIYPIDPVTAAQLIQSGTIKQAFAQVIDAPLDAPIMVPAAPPTLSARKTKHTASASTHEPQLFDWSDAECCLGLLNCPVTKMRCEYCGDPVNSNVRSYHKRCKKDFCVY